MADLRVEAPRLYLRPMLTDDAHGPYAAWMVDPLVLRHLEARHQVQTPDSLRSYIASLANEADTFFLAIMLKEDERHIGNVKLGPIDRRAMRAEIGILLGARELWGRGYATEAISALSTYAFHELGLHRLQAGCYAGNVGSTRAFEKAGFVLEGRLKEYWQTENGREDQLILGRLATKNDRT